MIVYGKHGTRRFCGRKVSLLVAVPEGAAEELIMKGHKVVLMGMLAMALTFGLMMTGCSSGGTGTGTPSGGGNFTVTGIPAEWNGKYVVASSTFSETNPFLILGTATKPKLTDPWNYPGVRISGTSVTIPLWILNTDETISSYTGNDTATPFQVWRLSSSSMTNDDQIVAGLWFGNVTFSNGSATVAASTGVAW
jgi:hypothetical protein